MRELKVGRISFANCTPIFMALEEEGPMESVRLVNGVPTLLNRMLLEGEIDISPSSSVAYLRDPQTIGFLPDLSISAIGDVGSVMLFSRVPLGALHGEKVGLTPSSATSVVLLRVLLESFGAMEPEYVEEDGECAATLLIGDRALSEAKGSNWPYQYDLGRLWFEATTTPFVFALWLVRRKSYADDPQKVRAFYRRLVSARQRAYRNYLEYSRRAPEAAWLGEKNLLEYWGTISYDLTAWHMAGLKRFSLEAAKLGLIYNVSDLLPLPVEGD